MKGLPVSTYKAMVKVLSDKELADGVTWEDAEPMMYKTLGGAKTYNFNNYKKGTTWAYENHARLYQYNKTSGEYDEIDKAYPIYFARYVVEEYRWDDTNIIDNPGYEFLKKGYK